MTRGYIVILDGKKIKRLVYSNSDSYFCKDESLPAGLILEAMKKEDVLVELTKRLDEEVKNGYMKEEEFYKEDTEYKFYIKTKENEDDFFVDYVYEYNIKTKKLTVYHFGKKMIQFTKNDIEYMDYIFENDNDFYQAFAYNEDTCKYENYPVKTFVSFMKERKPVAEIKTLVEELIAKHRIAIDNYNIVDCWGQYHYKKSVKVYDKKGKPIHTFEFCVAPINWSSYMTEPPKNYSMSIQLPYYRCEIFSIKNNAYRPKYYSKTSLEKAFVEYIKDEKVQEELLQAVPLYEIYKKYHSEFNEIWEKVKEMKNKEEQLETLKKKEKPFLNRLNKELEPFKDITFSYMMRNHGKHFNAEVIKSELMEYWYKASRYWIEDVNCKKRA